MAKSRSWWRMRQIRHRDAAILSVLSSSFLLAGELVNNDLRTAYDLYILPYAGDPSLFPRFLLNVVLTVLGFTTYFGGIFVLLGIVSHTLMGQYALMLKKHARRVWRRWRKTQRPTRREPDSEGRATSSGRTGRAARR